MQKITTTIICQLFKTNVHIFFTVTGTNVRQFSLAVIRIFQPSPKSYLYNNTSVIGSGIGCIAGESISYDIRVSYSNWTTICYLIFENRNNRTI